MRSTVCDNMTECARIIETRYFKGPRVLDTDHSICDPYLAPAARWFSHDGVDLDTFKLINAHVNLVRQRGSMQRVLELHGEASLISHIAEGIWQIYLKKDGSGGGT